MPPAAAQLRAEIAAADVMLFCTPEYAGTLPGSLKNLLDWTGGGAEIYRKPVAWINVAAPSGAVARARRLAQQRSTLRITAHGLTDDQARATPTVSRLSVGGLIKHELAPQPAVATVETAAANLRRPIEHGWACAARVA